MSKHIRRIAYSAIAAAIVFVITRILALPIGSSGAYVNMGDVAIYFLAYLLGGPMAAIAAAVGSSLADVTAGAAVYAPATFIIKGLMGLTVGLILRRKKFWLYVMACAIGGAIMTVGYALYETALPSFGFAYALVNIPFNLGQWGVSLAAAIILYPVAQRIYKAAHFDTL